MNICNLTRNKYNTVNALQRIKNQRYTRKLQRAIKNRTIMNIWQLKNYIKDLPDDMEVWVNWECPLLMAIDEWYVEWDFFVLS